MFLRHAMGLLWQGLGLSGTTAANGQALSGNTLIQGMTNGIMGLFGKKKTETATTSALEYVSDRESTAVNAATDVAVAEPKGFFVSVYDGLKSAFSSACDFLSGLLPDSIKNINWQGIWNDVCGWFKSAFSTVDQWFGGSLSAAGG